MHLMYFTEQPMSAYPEQAGRDFGATALMFSNKHFDPVAGSRLYNNYIEQYMLAEEVGVDGIMLNEHHNAPFCMQAKANIFAAILAGMTKKVKIVMLGNPLPLAENPIRLAEELAMIDMISKGRLVSGFVRGGGQEQLATGVNPAFNRERFEEAHDLIVKAWTQTGPFRYEGTHYQHRVVNPWAVPLQKPYPRVWIPGVISKETIVWAAQQRYPYIALNTSIEQTKKIWELYDKVALETGYVGGPENRGYLIQVHISDNEEKAIENAKQFRWMQGEFTGLAHPVWSTPSGYGSPTARRAFVEFAAGRAINPRGNTSFEQQMADLRIIAGTPKTVVAKLKRILEETRPGILALWGNDGRVSQEDSLTCIRLMGTEVFPAIREIAKELDLKSPFEFERTRSSQLFDRSEEEQGRGRIGSDLLDHRFAEAFHLGDHRFRRRAAEIDIDRRDAHVAQRAQVGDEVGFAAGEQPPLAIRCLRRHRRAIALHAKGDLDGGRIAPGVRCGLAQPRDARLQPRQRVEQMLVVAADGIPGVADASGAAQGGGAFAADPDRRMRPLHRLGLQHDAVELGVTAGKARCVLGP